MVVVFNVARAALCADDAQEQIAILDRLQAVLQIGQCGFTLMVPRREFHTL